MTLTVEPFVPAVAIAQELIWDLTTVPAVGDVLGRVIPSDEGLTGPVTYAITAGDPAGTFAIDAATGDVTLASLPDGGLELSRLKVEISSGDPAVVEEVGVTIRPLYRSPLRVLGEWVVMGPGQVSTVIDVLANDVNVDPAAVVTISDVEGGIATILADRSIEFTETGATHGGFRYQVTNPDGTSGEAVVLVHIESNVTTLPPVDDPAGLDDLADPFSADLADLMPELITPDLGSVPQEYVVEGLSTDRLDEFTPEETAVGSSVSDTSTVTETVTDAANGLTAVITVTTTVSDDVAVTSGTGDAWTYRETHSTSVVTSVVFTDAQGGSWSRISVGSHFYDFEYFDDGNGTVTTDLTERRADAYIFDASSSSTSTDLFGVVATTTAEEYSSFSEEIELVYSRVETFDVDGTTLLAATTDLSVTAGGEDAYGSGFSLTTQAPDETAPGETVGSGGSDSSSWTLTAAASWAGADDALVAESFTYGSRGRSESGSSSSADYTRDLDATITDEGSGTTVISDLRTAGGGVSDTSNDAFRLNVSGQRGTGTDGNVTHSVSYTYSDRGTSYASNTSSTTYETTTTVTDATGVIYDGLESGSSTTLALATSSYETTAQGSYNGADGIGTATYSFEDDSFSESTSGGYATTDVTDRTTAGLTVDTFLRSASERADSGESTFSIASTETLTAAGDLLYDETASSSSSSTATYGSFDETVFDQTDSRDPYVTTQTSYDSLYHVWNGFDEAEDASETTYAVLADGSTVETTTGSGGGQSRYQFRSDQGSSEKVSDATPLIEPPDPAQFPTEQEQFDELRNRVIGRGITPYIDVLGTKDIQGGVDSVPITDGFITDLVNLDVDYAAYVEVTETASRSAEAGSANTTWSDATNLVTTGTPQTPADPAGDVEYDFLTTGTTTSQVVSDAATDFGFFSSESAGREHAAGSSQTGSASADALLESAGEQVGTVGATKDDAPLVGVRTTEIDLTVTENYAPDGTSSTTRNGFDRTFEEYDYLSKSTGTLGQPGASDGVGNDREVSSTSYVKQEDRRDYTHLTEFSDDTKSGTLVTFRDHEHTQNYRLTQSLSGGDGADNGLTGTAEAAGRRSVTDVTTVTEIWPEGGGTEADLIVFGTQTNSDHSSFGVTGSMDMSDRPADNGSGGPGRRSQFVQVREGGSDPNESDFSISVDFNMGGATWLDETIVTDTA
ncbi:MAG: cadherin repeat domain-containing protein, partial [Planctomycetota bacterium]